MTLLLDYGVGNLASIKKMLHKIGVDVVSSANPRDLEVAEKIILPGVGAFDNCVSRLKDTGLTDELSRHALERKKPLLGICVGMQMLTNGSEEGILPGFGWIKGKCVRFKKEALPLTLKIPHMGWTNVKTAKPSRLCDYTEEELRFYFVHSFHVQLENVDDALFTAEYGYQFVAGVERSNILGVQFHPEKSHKYGMQLLENFMKKY